MSPVHTVNGPIAPDMLGTTLIHEHVMVDFGGAAITGPHRWDCDEVVGVMQPYLQELVAQGVKTLVECTPAYLGRDPELLRRLSTLTGLHIVTNTGLYKEPYLPEWTFGLEPASLAERWSTEYADGIGETGIKPGFVKIAVNPGELLPIQRTIVRAAAITHRTTGLAVMAHTGNEQAAHESLDLVEDEKMSPERYVVAHADQIGAGVMPGDAGWADVLAAHQGLLERGTWLEYDSIGWGAGGRHVALLLAMLDLGYEAQLLISQDAGWYHVGEPGGGTVQSLAGLIDDFVPDLRAAGVDTATMTRLLVDNPARVLTVP